MLQPETHIAPEMQGFLSSVQSPRSDLFVHWHIGDLFKMNTPGSYISASFGVILDRSLQCSLWSDVYQIDPIPQSTTNTYSKVYHLRLDCHFVAEIKSYAALPDELLCGPWTQSQGDILSFFTGRVVTGHMSLAGRGQLLAKMEASLTTAIQMECLPALAVFGGSLADILVVYLASRGSADPVAPDYPDFQKDVDEDMWSKPIIVVAGEAVADLLWQANHINLLLDKALERGAGSIWRTLVRDVQSDLKTREARRLAKAATFLNQIDEYQDIGQIKKQTLHAKRLRSKTTAPGFALL